MKLLTLNIRIHPTLFILSIQKYHNDLEILSRKNCHDIIPRIHDHKNVHIFILSIWCHYFCQFDVFIHLSWFFMFLWNRINTRKPIISLSFLSAGCTCKGTGWIQIWMHHLIKAEHHKSTLLSPSPYSQLPINREHFWLIIIMKR